MFTKVYAMGGYHPLTQSTLTKYNLKAKKVVQCLSLSVDLLNNTVTAIIRIIRMRNNFCFQKV